MTKLLKNTACTVMVMIFIGYGMLSAGASGTAQNEQLIRNELISRLNSGDAKQRSKAVFEISTLLQKGIVIKEAVPGLIKELERIDFEHLSETSGEYSAELIYILGEYRDERAIPALLAGLSYAGGTAVTEAYAKMGPTLLDSLIIKAQNESLSVRIAALFYIGKLPSNMIKYGYRLSQDQKSKIKYILLSSLKDGNPSVRSSAITAVDEIQAIYDKDALSDYIALLESLSRNDPHHDQIQTNVYPLRIDAVRVLDHLKARR